MIDGKMQDDATWKQAKVLVDLARLVAARSGDGRSVTPCILPSIITAPVPSGNGGDDLPSRMPPRPDRARTLAWRSALAWMQRPGADAAHQERIAELHSQACGSEKSPNGP